jgi:glycosyltransferase involved in cell wall biosynthesis
MLVSAAGIICNSAVTQAALIEFAEKSDAALPPNVVAWISGPPAASGIQKHLEQAYFVTVGTIEARKNHLLLLEVWKSLVTKLGSQAPLLIIIGQRGWEADAAISILNEPAELERHVYELGRCDDKDLANWLIGARALLMPSFAEGFGLPVVEALQLGVPVIASDLPVYHEIVGKLPSYLDPTDAESWERMIMAFMADAGERARQIRNMHTFQPPNWASHFEIIEDWVQQL